MEYKEEYNPDKLCDGLPEEFPTLLKYARKLDFDEKPDYKNMKIMFKQLITGNGGIMDWIFDWDLNKSNNYNKHTNNHYNKNNNIEYDAEDDRE